MHSGIALPRQRRGSIGRQDWRSRRGAQGSFRRTGHLRREFFLQIEKRLRCVRVIKRHARVVWHAIPPTKVRTRFFEVVGRRAKSISLEVMRSKVWECVTSRRAANKFEKRVLLLRRAAVPRERVAEWLAAGGISELCGDAYSAARAVCASQAGANEPPRPKHPGSRGAPFGSFLRAT